MSKPKMRYGKTDQRGEIGGILVVKYLSFGLLCSCNFAYPFAFMVITMECIGDVTATTEASHLEPHGPDCEKRIQGSTVAQGLNSFFGHDDDVQILWLLFKILLYRDKA